MSTIYAVRKPEKRQAIPPVPQPQPTKKKREKRRKSWRAYAEQRGVSTRTLDRWVVTGRLPPPEYINGRKYIDPDTEPRQDADAA